VGKVIEKILAIVYVIIIATEMYAAGKYFDENNKAKAMFRLSIVLIFTILLIRSILIVNINIYN